MDPLLIAVWGVVGVATIGLVWSLFADRPRGRLRCPRCWYTIDMPTRTECPECGRAITNERQLERTRRHPWRSGFVALLLIGAIYGTTCVESIRRDGWLGVVPTIALVAVTDGEDAWKWQQARPPSRAVGVLLDRMKEHRSSLWSRRLWAAKAADAMPEIPPPRVPIELERTVVRVYDLSAFAPLVPFPPFDPSSVVGVRPAAVLNDRHPADAREIVLSVCRFEAWQRHGGVEARGRLVGDQLIVRASESHQREIDDVVAMLAGLPRRIGEPIDVAKPTQSLIRYELPIKVPVADVTAETQDLLLELWRDVQLENWKDLWQAWGGMEAQAYIFRDTFVIETTPDHHAELAAYIDAMAADRPKLGR